jgi:hypothetical protein
LWRNGKVADLGPGAAHAINRFDDIVGTVNEKATLWRDGSAVDLNTYLSRDKGITLLNAKGINDRGQIIGDYTGPSDFFGSYDRGAYILTPVPEAETWLFLLLGIAMLAYKQRSS